ncbi:DNA-3-methyladenine glycosylase I [Desulforhopalus singaporensis]|uniref:DNA-3-methyladenine glycosylase I n=1 Tax=Desulforhopalus singaporensis TaxID=91360 RepID=A0A1H0U7C8_9BACT|nr:DNA-3-methyladenine glycosylase I [Desulforhopalus singaporensis]SDP61885.1 DNA-3-methyladenine glycosylase I [Desulforhopalus singaporensis]
MKNRCEWCGNDPLYRDYHDHQWGVPEHDDFKLFEMLCLEGAQAGLSWLTILRKRKSYQEVFSNFDFTSIASYTERDIAALMTHPGIVKNRLKINAVVKNAAVVIDIIEEKGNFSSFLWDYVDGVPLQNKWRSMQEVPSQTELSRRLSRDLKKRGMSFVGPTICYSLMQSVGMVNDHLVNCFRHQEIQRLSQHQNKGNNLQP